ncbi:MAG: methyltransferase [Chloroflexi bacterium]|nr:methyltransferase [Chloroflexota bacterium]
MLTPRARVELALTHRQPDRVPFDLGATSVTGISASSLYRLRGALGLPARPVQIHEPYQMLGKLDEDVLDALGVDIIGLGDDSTFFGYPQRDWKPFTLFDGTPVLVPGGFNTQLNPDGSLYQYPQGDRSLAPSAHMPAGGYYHDAIERQQPYDPEMLDAEEWVRDMYHAYTEEELRLLETRSQELFESSARALIGNFGQGGFGDIAFVPGTAIPHPKGIRAVADWYMATALYPEYIHSIFNRQCEIALHNLELYRQAVGSRICTIFISGTDFGSQDRPFISPEAYRALYKPYHKKLNDWVHAHTSWKTFYHTCGSITEFLDDFIEAGVDIINPVQISAAGMQPEELKRKWGDRLVFWGGGVDTQRILPFGTPDEITADVHRNITLLGQGGGMVFSAVHNIQSGIPEENLLALVNALSD